MTQAPKRLGFFTRLLDQTTPAERYRFATEQIVHAERNGFDSAWVAQHHFHEDEGGLPSPFPFLAYVAAQTSRIRLGTGVITLPMEDAIRVAEDAIVVDLLSGGRLEVGLGAGSTPASFEAFGITADQRHDTYQARRRTLLDAWSGRPLGHEENRLYPAASHLIDRVWLASFSVFGGVQAGAAGDGLMLSRTQPRPQDQPGLRLDEIQNPIIDAYLGALPQGRAPRIVASRSLFVADDHAEALRLAEAGLSRVAHRFAAQGHRIGDGSLQDVIKALDVHVGTADDVIETLRADTSLARATDIVFQVHSVDPPHPLILRSIELTAAKVAPALGWVNQHAHTKPRLTSVG
jgi:putative FMN-dependent luciferase-like monooxygenase